MKKFYQVNVRNRFDNDRVTEVKYFTTKEKAYDYAAKVNAIYEERRAAKDYGRLVYHIDMDYGIKELVADEDEDEG